MQSYQLSDNVALCQTVTKLAASMSIEWKSQAKAPIAEWNFRRWRRFIWIVFALYWREWLSLLASCRHYSGHWPGRNGRMAVEEVHFLLNANKSMFQKDKFKLTFISLSFLAFFSRQRANSMMEVHASSSLGIENDSDSSALSSSSSFLLLLARFLPAATFDSLPILGTSELRCVTAERCLFSL